MVVRLLFSGIKHLCQDDIFRFAISSKSILASETNGMSLVAGSRSFSLRDVMSQDLDNNIFNDILRGLKKTPEMSKLCGVS